MYTAPLPWLSKLAKVANSVSRNLVLMATMSSSRGGQLIPKAAAEPDARAPTRRSPSTDRNTGSSDFERAANARTLAVLTTSPTVAHPDLHQLCACEQS
ncbi:hypothetical protein J6590_065380 [Homalodisca vitripennis]|nr:hypothetical protein J6590_065380 [Homalodisca vitripennis]